MDLLAARPTDFARPAPSGLGPQAATPDEETSFSFWDFLDVLNPLQHLPIVGNIYRTVTGDTLDMPARLAGAALWGGGVGVALAAADLGVEALTGRDTLGNVLHVTGLDEAFSGDAAGEPDAAPPRPIVTIEPAPPAPANAAAEPLPPAPANLPLALLPQALAAPWEEEDAARRATGAQARAPTPAPRVPDDLPQRMMAALDRYQAAARAEAGGAARP